MDTPWIPEAQLRRALIRNEAFWHGTLEEYPLLWVTAGGIKPGTPPTPPPADEEEWTDVEYQIAKADDFLSRTYYAADALPVFCPWLGPDQFAAWLGADLTFSSRDNTSWVKPFITEWGAQPSFNLDPQNRWWEIYRQILTASAERGRGKWITGYPDLHTGIDALGAIRGPENLMIDLITAPQLIQAAMEQMTRLWKQVVDLVSGIVLATGQGTSNWTMGWSAKRFMCIGQNDFSCLISPAMFDRFVLEDTVSCARYVDRTIYHLDGPGALQHLPRLLGIESLHCIQWIQGAGKPLPSRWLQLLQRIQDAGKSVQVCYGAAHGGKAEFTAEIEALCSALDPRRLFIWIDARSAEEADFLVQRAKEVCRQKRIRPL